MESRPLAIDAEPAAQIANTETDMTNRRTDPAAAEALKAAPELTAGTDWVACPEPDCDATAEVVDRYPLSSTDGPVSMMRTRCLGRHVRDWIDDETRPARR
jgi:hypothetical protein